MRHVITTALVAIMIMVLGGPPPASAESQEGSAPELQAQIEALTAKVAALNVTLGAAVSQIAALATAMVTLQAQMVTGHGAIASKAVFAGLPTPNVVMPARQIPVEDTKAEHQAAPRSDQYRFLGYLVQNGESCAFLGKGTELYIVRRGETVDGRLQVTAIDAASVKLLDPSTSQETTLLLAKFTEGPS